jgi:hypothetical protein
LCQVDGRTGDVAGVIRDPFEQRRGFRTDMTNRKSRAAGWPQDEDIDALPIDFYFNASTASSCSRTSRATLRHDQPVHASRAQGRFSFATETKHRCRATYRVPRRDVYELAIVSQIVQ